MTPERKNKLKNVLTNRQGNLTIVLENVEDPRNIAAVMRSCDAVGIQDIYILNHLPSYKPLHRFSYKSGSSVEKWVTLHQYCDVQECIKALRSNYEFIYTTHLSADSVNIYDADFTKSVALVFGNEHNGVSPEMLSLADGNIKIPQVGMIQSLNISVACAVTMYEAFRQKLKAGHYNKPSFSPERLAQLSAEWGLGEG